MAYTYSRKQAMSFAALNPDKVKQEVTELEEGKSYIVEAGGKSYTGSVAGGLLVGAREVTAEEQKQKAIEESRKRLMVAQPARGDTIKVKSDIVSQARARQVLPVYVSPERKISEIKINKPKPEPDKPKWTPELTKKSYLGEVATSKVEPDAPVQFGSPLRPITRPVGIKTTEYEVPRGTTGLAGFLSAYSSKSWVRKEGLYATKEREFKLYEEKKKAEGVEDLGFGYGLKKKISLGFAEKPELYIAAPAVGAAFGVGGTMLASSGTLGATVVGYGTTIGLGAEAVVLGSIKASKEKELGRKLTKAEVGELYAEPLALTTLGLAGGISGGYQAQKWGYVPYEAGGLKLRRTVLETELTGGKIGKRTLGYQLGLEWGTKAKVIGGVDLKQYAEVSKMPAGIEPGITRLSGKQIESLPFKVPKQEFAVVKGTPKLNLNVLGKSEYISLTSATSGVVLGKALGKKSLSDVAILLRETKGVRSVFMRDLPTKTSRLSKAELTEVYKFVIKKGMKIKGSLPQQAQVRKEYVRDIGDVDIMPEIFKKSDVAQLLKKLRKSSPKTRFELSPESEGGIVKYIKGKPEKVVEILGGAGQPEAPATFFGVPVEGMPIKISGQKVQSLEKQFVSKGASIFSIRRGTTGEVAFSPKTGRSKDVPDFFASGESLLASKKGTTKSQSILRNLVKEFPEESMVFQRGGKEFFFDFSKTGRASIGRAISSGSIGARASTTFSSLNRLRPSASISASPRASPSLKPSLSLLLRPSSSPSISPRLSPSVSPSILPSLSPSISPSLSPSLSPSISPRISPSLSPSISPSLSPYPSPIVPDIIPPISFGGFGIPRSRLGKGSKGKTQYRKSLRALFTPIRFKSLEKMTLSGFEVRG